MSISNHAEKLLIELHQLDLIEILENHEYWEKKMARMNKDKKRLFMEQLEELEAEGYLFMSVKADDEGHLIPQKVILKKRKR